MKFGKILALGAILSMSATVALADTITFTGTEAASGITGTGVSFGNKVTTGVHTNQSAETISSTSGTVLGADFTSGTGKMWLTPPLVSANPAMKLAQSTPPTTPNQTTFPYPTVSNPIHFAEVIQGGETLEFYITSITTHTTAATGVTGGFTASGYFTLTGYSGDIAATIALTNTSTGSGAKTYNATITSAGPFNLIPSVPEPNTLALLGTGILGIAGLGRRKFIKA